MSLAFDESGRPFIILREQSKKKRIKGLEAHKVSFNTQSINNFFLYYYRSTSLPQELLPPSSRLPLDQRVWIRCLSPQMVKSSSPMMVLLSSRRWKFIIKPLDFLSSSQLPKITKLEMVLPVSSSWLVPFLSKLKSFSIKVFIHLRLLMVSKKLAISLLPSSIKLRSHLTLLRTITRTSENVQ